jgi:hypothetical protein
MIGSAMTPPPSNLGADYWRKRAAELRAMAETVPDADTKRDMLAIADNYDQLAAQAEAQGKTGRGANGRRKGARRPRL